MDRKLARVTEDSVKKVNEKVVEVPSGLGLTTKNDTIGRTANEQASFRGEKMEFKLEFDRHPGRKVWLGSLEDMISGLQLRTRVKMKPRLLKLSEERWLRVDPEETLALEKSSDGKGIWHTLRGSFHDLSAPSFEEAVEKANRCGVYVTISNTHAISPHRIIGIRLQREGFHILELEGPDGEPLILDLEPTRLPLLEECLDAINLGDGFLITDPEEE